MNNVLVVDCNDSFVYNLVQLLDESRLCAFRVVNVQDIPFNSLGDFSHILLSPGPGLPSDFPNLTTLLQVSHNTHAILGVCLGMQAIGEHFGCRLTQLSHPQHGHESALRIADKDELLFKNIEQHTVIGRYHSWVVDKDCLADDIIVTAYDDHDNIMAIRHKRYDIRGVQFHPESKMTLHGMKMIENWLRMR